MNIRLTINGDVRQFECEPQESLRHVLRREGFFSVRFGAETGETGADAILLDGRLVSSEIMLAAQADGHEIETIEGLSPGRGMHPIQEAFVTVGAIQSGYSTPAMVLAAKALLDENPSPTEAEIRDALTGILDRETGYLRPVEAILRAAAVLRGEGVETFEPVLVRPLADIDGNADFASSEPPLDLPRAAPRVVPSPEVPDTQVVGKPEVKVDALKLVKGNPAFVDDVEIRGMLYAKMLWSPHAHARIVSIDDTKARVLPGVRAVLHHENVARVRYASGGQSYPNPLPYDQVSFDNKVRHVGDRVAVVAADTLEIAEAAVELIEVEYEVLPAIFDERESMKDGAPVIHDEPDMEGAFDASRNIVHHIRADVGDVEAGFAEADHVFEKTFRVHQVQPAPIEPHIAIAWLDSDERLIVRTSTQVPFHVRRMLAPLLDLPGPSNSGRETPHRRRIRREARDADRRHRGSPGPRDRPAGSAGVDASRGIRFEQNQASANHHDEDGREPGREARRPGDANDRQYRAIRHARADRADGERVAGSELLQLSQQAFRL